ncbi:MAG: hypothetical protein ACOH2H_10635 [Cypionkella sp.]
MMRTVWSRRTRAAGFLTALGLMGACVEPPPPATPDATIAAKIVNYTCTGNHRMAVSYGASTATLAGPETLLLEADGQRYSWPSDGTHHVWALKDGIGTLSLHDGTKGTDSVVQSGCKPDAPAT